MTEEEKKLFRLYGKLPTHKNVFTKVQQDRKYFDSGDYALSKAGIAPQANVGTAIPSPENIPHATPTPTSHNQPLSTSPPNVTSVGSAIIPTSTASGGSPPNSPIQSSPIKDSIAVGGSD